MKVNRVPIGDVIRQIKLYKEYYRGEGHWVLATIYTITEEEKKVLLSEKIQHILVLEKNLDMMIDVVAKSPEL